MVALDTQWNISVLSKVLMCCRMKEAELSSRDVSLSLCSSTSSYLHIVDCTHLTGWLFPNPQCPLASTLYKHPTNLERNSHYLPTHTGIHLHILPFPLLALRVCLQWPIGGNDGGGEKQTDPNEFCCRKCQACRHQSRRHTHTVPHSHTHIWTQVER